MQSRKQFKDKIRSKLESYGIITLVSKRLSVGFPDLIAIDKKNNKTYFLTLKYSTSTKNHKGLLSKVQFGWMDKLPDAFVFVFVPGEDLFVYQAHGNRLILLDKIVNMENVIRFLRD